MSIATTVEIYDETVALPPVSGSTPFGYYDSDASFVADMPKFVTYAYRKLGGLIEEVELATLHYYGLLS